MKKELMSEDDVKKALKIKNFRSIPKNKIMEFISLIPKLDKEIAISIINQFPNYADMATKMIGNLIGLCDNAMKDASKGTKEVIESYKSILSTLQQQVSDDNLSYEQKKEVNEQMIQIADKISNENSKRNEIVDNIIKYGGSIVGGALVLGAVILGVNSKDSK